MSATGGIYDVAAKPGLLRALLKHYVPDEKHSFSDPSELSQVISTVKTLNLLSEWAPQPLEQDLIDAWKSAVDSWVNHLLTLASSNLPDKCQVGICLLGLTFQECSSERFLTSYAAWLTKLLSHIQPPAVSHLVRADACASISDLFTRLSGFSNAKKDATSQATKVIQPALKLLNEDSSDVVLEGAVCLLCTMINFFPLSVHRHYDSVESAIVSKLVSGSCSASVLKKLGYGLSLLPKSRGDEDSWSLMMDKILLYINNQLNDAFQGLEEEASGTQTLRALFPAGKESPPPLGGLTESEIPSGFSTKRPERLLGSRISTLMECCCNMLTSSYPVMVPVPIRGLIALTGRVLMVDGSLSPSYSFMTTLKEELICSEIPSLQLHSLEILAAVVQGLKSQLLPHAASIVQLLNEYLRRCRSPDWKIKAYSIVKLLLMSMGVGIAIHIGQGIVSNIFIDLDFPGGDKDGKSLNKHIKVHGELLSGSRQKKRKHSSMARSFQEQPAHDGLEVEMLHNLTPISVKIAALEALEALLSVGASMRSETWRGNVDNLLITLATDGCKGGWAREEKSIFLSDDPTPGWADFQLAALRALNASLLSTGQECPSHLALGLELFRRGTQEAGTMLAEHCREALLSLDVFIHPRAPPLLDMHSTADEFRFLSRKLHEQTSTYQAGTFGKGPDDLESEDDDLNENWIRDDDEMEIQPTETQHDVHYLPEKPLTAPKDPSLDELPSDKRASITEVPKTSEITESASGPNNKSMDDSQDHMVESPRLRNTAADGNILSVESEPADGNIRSVESEPADGNIRSVESEPVSGKNVLLENDTTVKSDGVSEECDRTASTTEQHVSETKNDERSAIIERISATLSNIYRGRGLLFEDDNELSSDSLPDIADGDPDSDLD